MAFTDEERQALLAVKGVGPTVIQRFEEVGVDSFAKLAGFDAKELATLVAKMLNASCWANAPRAVAAVDAAIARAKQGL